MTVRNHLKHILAVSIFLIVQLLLVDHTVARTRYMTKRNVEDAQSKSGNCDQLRKILLRMHEQESTIGLDSISECLDLTGMKTFSAAVISVSWEIRSSQCDCFVLSISTDVCSYTYVLTFRKEDDAMVNMLCIAYQCDADEEEKDVSSRTFAVDSGDVHVVDVIAHYGANDNYSRTEERRYIVKMINCELHLEEE